MSGIRKNKNMIYFLHETDNDNLAILWILGELLNLYHPEHINYRHRKGNVVMTLCNFETKENTPIVVLLKSDKSIMISPGLECISCTHEKRTRPGITGPKVKDFTLSENNQINKDYLHALWLLQKNPKQKN